MVNWLSVHLLKFHFSKIRTAIFCFYILGENRGEDKRKKEMRVKPEGCQSAWTLSPGSKCTTIQTCSDTPEPMYWHHTGWVLWMPVNGFCFSQELQQEGVRHDCEIRTVSHGPADVRAVRLRLPHMLQILSHIFIWFSHFNVFLKKFIGV